jgi:ribosome-associated toxin RatA of RatAB toxin-antitoxin module
MAESGTASIEIDASIEELFEIVTDVESYPEWVKGVQEIEVLERDGDGRPLLVRQRVDASIKVLTYVLRYEYDSPERVSWESEPGGDVKHVAGAYSFEMNDDGGTEVTYELTLDPGFPAPGFMVRKAAKSIMHTALDGLKARAES